MVDFKQIIAKEISKAISVPKEELKSYIEIPKDLNNGDYAFPCFRLAKTLKKAPQVIANEIKDFGEQKQKIFVLDISESSEEQKEKLRGAIRYFNGEKNNINVKIRIGEELRNCGQIYLNEKIKEIFEDIIGVDKVFLQEI